MARNASWVQATGKNDYKPLHCGEAFTGMCLEADARPIQEVVVFTKMSDLKWGHYPNRLGTTGIDVCLDVCMHTLMKGWTYILIDYSTVSAEEREWKIKRRLIQVSWTTTTEPTALCHSAGCVSSQTLCSQSPGCISADLQMALRPYKP